MNIILIVAIILINFASIGIIYRIIRKIEKKQKILFIAICIAIMYILVSIAYWLSGFGIDEDIHEATKDFIVYLFVPVNMILIVPYLATQYMKLRNHEIQNQDITKKAVIMGVILLIVLIIEIFGFRSIQTNIGSITISQNNNITE